MKPSATYTPSRALDAKLDLMNFYETPLGSDSAGAFINVTRQTVHHRELFPPDWDGDRFAENESQRLYMAETFMVTEEMMDVCEYASRTLPNEEAMLTRDLLPVDRGFLVFEEPRHTVDVNGTVVGISAITWGHTVERSWGVEEAAGRPLGPMPGVRFNLYTSKFDDEDRAWDYSDEAAERHGVTVQEWRRTMARAYKMLPTLLLGHSMFIPYNAVMKPMDESDEELLARIKAGTSDRSWLAYIVAVFTMMGQTLASVEEPQIDRATQKRMFRAKVPGRITVIALRRSSGAHTDPEERGLVQWHHRWVVRGHWRRQPYGDGTTKLIWINAFIKGPEGMPFKQTEKVYVLKR